MSGLRLLMLLTLQMLPSRAAVVGRGAWVARSSVRPRSLLKANAARGWSFGNDGRWVSTEQVARAEAPPQDAAPTTFHSADAVMRRPSSHADHVYGDPRGPAAHQRTSAVASAVAAPAPSVAVPAVGLELPPVLTDDGDVAVHEVDTIEEVTSPLPRARGFQMVLFLGVIGNTYYPQNLQAPRPPRGRGLGRGIFTPGWR
jgi:hypothetical protein